MDFGSCGDGGDCDPACACSDRFSWLFRSPTPNLIRGGPQAAADSLNVTRLQPIPPDLAGASKTTPTRGARRPANRSVNRIHCASYDLAAAMLVFHAHNLV